MSTCVAAYLIVGAALAAYSFLRFQPYRYEDLITVVVAHVGMIVMWPVVVATETIEWARERRRGRD